MDCATNYKRYKTAQATVSQHFFGDTPPKTNFIATYIDCVLQRVEKENHLPNDLVTALEEVINGRRLALEYYVRLKDRTIFKTHMHSLRLFQWAKLALQRQTESSEYKTLAEILRVPERAYRESRSDAIEKATFAQTEIVLFLDDLLSLIDDAMRYSTMTIEGDCDFSTFGLVMNCIYTLARMIVAEADLLERDYLFDNISAEHRLSRELKPIREAILRFFEKGETEPWLLQLISPPKGLPLTPALDAVHSGLLEFSRARSNKSQKVLFSLSLTMLLCRKVQESWQTSSEELGIARSSALGTSLSLLLSTASDTLSRLFDCGKIFKIEEGFRDIRSRAEELADWYKNITEAPSMMNPWFACHVIAIVNTELQLASSQINQLSVLPAFCHLYLSQKIQQLVLPNAPLDTLIQRHQSLFFWRGVIPSDMNLLSQSYERNVARNRTAVLLTERKNQRVLDGHFLLAMKLINNDYRLDCDVVQYSQADFSQGLQKLLDAVHLKLKTQAMDSFDALDTQYIVIWAIAEVYADDQDRLSALKNPLAMPADLAHDFIAKVISKLSLLKKRIISRIPKFQPMPKIFHISHRQNGKVPGAPDILNGNDENGLSLIAFLKFDSGTNRSEKEIENGSSSLYVCLDLGYTIYSPDQR